jgi:hypothetical protein
MGAASSAPIAALGRCGEVPDRAGERAEATAAGLRRAGGHGCALAADVTHEAAITVAVQAAPAG